MAVGIISQFADVSGGVYERFGRNNYQVPLFGAFKVCPHDSEKCTHATVPNIVGIVREVAGGDIVGGAVALIPSSYSTRPHYPRIQVNITVECLSRLKLQIGQFYKQYFLIYHLVVKAIILPRTNDEHVVSWAKDSGV